MKKSTVSTRKKQSNTHNIYGIYNSSKKHLKYVTLDKKTAETEYLINDLESEGYDVVMFTINIT